MSFLLLLTPHFYFPSSAFGLRLTLKDKLFKHYSTSSDFEDAVEKIDKSVEAYNNALNDLNFALAIDARKKGNMIHSDVAKTVGSMCELHHKIDILPHRVSEMLNEPRSSTYRETFR